MASPLYQMQRHGQGVAAQPSDARPVAADVQYGYVEPVLYGGEGGAVDAVEEPAVGRAAAQVHVLAVVDGQLVAGEGEGETAEARAALDEGHAHSGVGELERGGDTGDAAADDDRVARRRNSGCRHAPSPAPVGVRDATGPREVDRGARDARRAPSDSGVTSAS